MAEICVGVTSRLVAEEAANLGVAQVIASRRQVNAAGGYTGLTQADLVRLVRERSDVTQVVRDHGGPYQNGADDDDWELELDQDVAAGFDGLHLDVSKLDRSSQPAVLKRLVNRYDGKAAIQVGGERDEQPWNSMLAAVAVSTADCAPPTHVVISMGGYVTADRNRGQMMDPSEARNITRAYRALGMKTVAHNMDFIYRRKYQLSVDAFNIAPEYGVIETEAWLRFAPPGTAKHLLNEGYESRRWSRWFDSTTGGSKYERARCGLRYIWATLLPQLQTEAWYAEAEPEVRKVMRDAISAG